MCTGTVSYSARITDLELEELVLSHPHQQVVKITLKTEKYSEDHTSLNITFTLRNVLESDTFGIITNPIVDSFLDRLAFKYAVFIGKPHCTGYSLPDQSGTKHRVLSSHLASWDHLEGTIKPGPQGLQNLKTYLETPKLPGEHLYSLFNFSASQNNPVARFMFLYNILLSLNNDEQSDVDNFIRQEEPNVRLVQSSYTKRGQQKTVTETIYSCLRNQVGHKRGAQYQNTYEEISDNVGTFQALVKKALLQQP